MDESFEQAAKREAREETGDLELGDVEYVGTTEIDDWRYRAEPDTIMTTLFTAKKIYGNAKAGDDLDEVKWFNLYSLIQSNGYQLVEEHKVLLEMLKANLERKAEQEAKIEKEIERRLKEALEKTAVTKA